MGAWFKLFNDGSSERGSDLDIKKGKASWSRGRLDNIKAVQLFYKTLGCILIMPNTNWHQYDRYVAPLGTVGKNVSTRTAMVVQAEIKPEYLGKAININSSDFAGTTIVSLCNTPSKDDIFISQEHIGLWATIYILVNGQVGFTISKRGAFNGDKQVFK